MLAAMWWLHANWLLPGVIRMNRRMGVPETRLARGERLQNRFFKAFLIGATGIYVLGTCVLVAVYLRQH
jgi:hypothetical protein